MTATSPLPGPIAYLTGEYPRATDTFIQREVAGLRARGIAVETCSIRRTGAEHLVGPEQKAEAEATFYVLAAARAPLTLLRAHGAAALRAPARYFRGLYLAIKASPPGLRALIYHLFYFAEAVLLADHLQKKGVTHLHNHIATASCTVAMLASAVSGIPYSFTLHGPGIFYEPMLWRLDLKIARARFVACISDFCRSQAMMFSDRADWDKLHVVHCGVDPELYDAPPPTPHAPHAVFVGRLAAVKGVPVLFAALTDLRQQFPDLAVTLIGDGPERADLEGEARRLGLSEVVSFAGYRSQAEVAETLKSADLLVLPSFAEGVPVVLMEAMAARVPVVTSHVAGIPELVEDGVSGALVPPGDSLTLTARIAELLADPPRRRRMGEAGRAKVIAEFNIATETAWLADILAAYAHGGPVPGKRPDREAAE